MSRGSLSKGLTLEDLRRMGHAAVVAARAGYPLNSFLTLTPPRDIPPADRPNLWNRERGRLSQRIRRLGLPFIAQFVRELKADDEREAGEHLHGLLYLPPGVGDKVLRAFSSDIDAALERNKGPSGISSRLAYMQKQRAGQAEGWMKMKRIRRYPLERPAPLVGPRWSMSGDLQGLVKADAGRPAVHVVRLPVQSTAQERHGLFFADELPVSPSPAMKAVAVSPRKREKIPPPSLPLPYPPTVADMLAALASTHLAAAELVGISRPHATNVIQYRFPPSRALARRILEVARAA